MRGRRARVCALADVDEIPDSWWMAELTGTMLYFAYGEDLPHAEFAKRCPGAEWFGPARLEEHRLVAGPRGCPNVKAERGATVWGALWMVPATLLPVLDTNAPEGFVRTTRRIVSPAGPRAEATLYLSTARMKGAGTLARLDALLAGAEENKLPSSYIKELKQVFSGAGGDQGGTTTGGAT